MADRLAIRVGGPEDGFSCLFDEDTTEGRELPTEFQRVYGRWPLPVRTTRPYLYTNFVMSHDGRVSFNQPGKSSGGPISRFSTHDRWGMALLRARADAVMMGASALADGRRHRATADALMPDDAAAWTALRQHEGRAPIPLHVVVTRSGRLAASSAILTDAAIPVLIVTTDAGAREAQPIVDTSPNVQMLATGPSVDYRGAAKYVKEEYGATTLLSEAGPNIYGGLMAAGVVDDEFLTLSPILVGNHPDQPRPSLIEGIAFDPNAPPQSRLLTLRRAGNYLFLQSRYATSDGA